jgi:hypothetical protein
MWVGKFLEKWPHGQVKSRWEENIKMPCQKADFGIGDVEPVGSSAKLLIITKLLVSILNYS